MGATYQLIENGETVEEGPCRETLVTHAIARHLNVNLTELIYADLVERTGLTIRIEERPNQ